MSWNDVWKICLSVLLNLGGFVGILTLIIPFSANIIADRLSKKYQLKMNKEFESYKNNLDKKTYISKARFDKEFEIHQELSEKVLTMVFNFAELVRTIRFDQEDDKEVIEKLLQAAVESYNKANRATRTYAPFMSEKIYKSFIQLGDKCRSQLNYHRLHYKVLPLEKEWERFGTFVTCNTHDYSKFETEEKFEEKFKANQREISESLDALMSTLRTYLSSLDVIKEDT